MSGNSAYPIITITVASAIAAITTENDSSINAPTANTDATIKYPTIIGIDLILLNPQYKPAVIAFVSMIHSLKPPRFHFCATVRTHQRKTAYITRLFVFKKTPPPMQEFTHIYSAGCQSNIPSSIITMRRSISDEQITFLLLWRRVDSFLRNGTMRSLSTYLNVRYPVTLSPPTLCNECKRTIAKSRR